MGLLDWFRKKVAAPVVEETFEGQRLVRLSETAARAVVVDAAAPEGVSASLCPRCGTDMVDALLATRLPGEPAQPAEWPFVVDGWVCPSCAAVAAPRFLSVDQSVAWGERGATLGRGGAHADAEWWFMRIAQAWPDYGAAWLDLTTSVYSWAQAVPEHQRPPLQDRQWTYLRRGARAVERVPERNAPKVAVEVLGRYAQVCTDRRDWKEARRVLEVMRALPMTPQQQARHDGFSAWLAREPDVFRAAADVVSPHLVLDGNRPAPIDAPQRAVMLDAIATLLGHYERHHEWNALWMVAKAQQALGQTEASLATFRRAEAAHGDVRPVVIEATLACLLSGLHDEAREMNRRGVQRHPTDADLWSNLAMCELLCGDFVAARAAAQRADAHPRTVALRRIIERWAALGRAPASFDELNHTPVEER